MRIKEGFVLREVAGQAMVIATGEASKEFHGMVKLNESGKIIWKGLMDGLTEQEIVAKLMEKYDVTSEKASVDVKTLVAKMKEAGFLEA